jgi:hypothetical protein
MVTAAADPRDGQPDAGAGRRRGRSACAFFGQARVQMPSACRPAIAAACGPNADTYTGTWRGGRS